MSNNFITTGKYKPELFDHNHHTLLVGTCWPYKTHQLYHMVVREHPVGEDYQGMRHKAAHLRNMFGGFAMYLPLDTPQD